MAIVPSRLKLPASAVAAGMLLATTAPAVQAQADTFYVGLDLHAWYLNPDRGSRWSDFGIRGRLGYRFVDQLAVEAHLATGGSDRANGERLEMDYLVGGFLRGDIPITRYASIYGLLGVSRLKVDVDHARVDSESSISFGLGFDYEVTRTTSLNIDYVRYISDSDYDYDALNVGGLWRF